jgi:hypothetical protein
MKTWNDKLHCGKKPQIKRLEIDFAGMKAGSLMYISTPLEVDQYVRGIPYGYLVSPKVMRDDLAKRNGADHTCPVSTGIFLRIVSEAAFEGYEEINSITEITPFWRIVAPDSDLAKKLNCSPEFIIAQRESEMQNKELHPTAGNAPV